jgi:hypothetical protein
MDVRDGGGGSMVVLSDEFHPFRERNNCPQSYII